jgi:Tfp pilus assembly protein FimT
MKKRRSGATLLEIMVVMAILIVVSALTVPSLRSMYGSYKLNASVDSVRAAWAEARERAINENRPYRFAVERNGSAYRIAPDDPAYWGGGNGPDNDPNGHGLILEKALPGGVRFTINGDGGGNMPDEPANDSLQEKEVTGGDWSQVVLFKPDGTADEDVKITFVVRGARPASLQLRGLTGNVTAHQE